MIVTMSTARGFVRHVLLLALAVAGVPAHTALAADARAADTGWFDPQTPSGAANAQAAPATPPPAAADARATPGAGQPVPGDGSNLPSLAPSPLLQDGNAQQASSQALDPQETNPRALTEFRSQLAPYGTWVQHPTYGTIWVPSASVVGTNFSPYVSSGHWALDEGNNWTWVSDFAFGNVVFHYGRWVWVGGTGWAWVPGYQYAPAWVTWRVPTTSTYAYVGWAPMPPSYLWWGGFAVSFWYGAYYPYYYCPSAYLFYPHVHPYVVRDPHLVHQLGYNTRVYAPAAVRGVTPRSSLSRASSPSLSAARVPVGSAQRVNSASQMAGAVPSGRAEHFSSAARLGSARPSFSRPDAGAARFRSDSFRSSASPERFRSAPASPDRFGSRPSSGFSPGRSSPSPSFSGSRPSFSGSRPSFSGSRPSSSFSGSRPSFSGSRPSFSGSRPSSSFSGSRPSFSGSRPSFGGGGGSRPSFGGSHGSFGGGSHGSFGGGSRGGGGRR